MGNQKLMVDKIDGYDAVVVRHSNGAISVVVTTPTGRSQYQRLGGIADLTAAKALIDSIVEWDKEFTGRLSRARASYREIMDAPLSAKLP